MSGSAWKRVCLALWLKVKQARLRANGSCAKLAGVSDSRPAYAPGTAGYPQIIEHAWAALGAADRICSIQEISANVSTNHVYLVRLKSGREVIGKTTLYGSYIHFRQDHRIIQQWINHSSGTRYRNFLARMLHKEDEVFTYSEDNTWVVFYEKTSFYDFLPSKLEAHQVKAFGHEMAEFHRVSTGIAPKLLSSWKSIGSDISLLYDVLGSSQWRQEHGMPSSVETQLRAQCDQFFLNAERLGYHHLPKIPLLVDWNIGNFSVGLEEQGFRLYSRWDYDWFRVEPRALDFYFCARVVRQEGDQQHFSYTAEPFFEERFSAFLKAYHATFALEDEEVLFIKEAYRFFLLNYVIRIGEHFFRSEYCQRLQAEAIEDYFPKLESLDFHRILKNLKSS